VLAAIPILVIGPLGGYFMSIAATGLIYISYFLCNLGVLAARRRGWPHTPAWFNLGRWGMPVNILALLYGGLMIINIGIWQDQNLFGNFGGDGRAFVNPGFSAFFTPFGQKFENLPAWPTFEVIVVTLLLTGALYYLVSVRGRAADVEADVATGEAVIA
jgi:uncharacterized membrane protein YhdT